MPTTGKVPIAKIAKCHAQPVVLHELIRKATSAIPHSSLRNLPAKITVLLSAPICSCVANGYCRITGSPA
jgi:hypothetical protein